MKQSFQERIEIAHHNSLRLLPFGCCETDDAGVRIERVAGLELHAQRLMTSWMHELEGIEDKNRTAYEYDFRSHSTTPSRILTKSMLSLVPNEEKETIQGVVDR